MKRLVSCLFSLLWLLGGCAHVMSEAGLALVDRSIHYGDIRKNPEILAGKTVLIGGVIARTRSSGDVMQLEVAQLELLSNGVPDETSVSSGRFLAMSGELMDPLFYSPGSLVTIIGEIKGQRVQKLDAVEYRYPLVSIKEIRLFRASETMPGNQINPYQSRAGESRFMLRPPGMAIVEPRRPY